MCVCSLIIFPHFSCLSTKKAKEEKRVPQTSKRGQEKGYESSKLNAEKALATFMLMYLC
jgi:hypothetical protein